LFQGIDPITLLLMTARLAGLMVCGEILRFDPLTLRDVRRRWKSPPESIWLIADIENPTEQSFSWDVELHLRNRRIDHLGETLELSSPTQLYLPVQLSLADPEPLMYSLVWLLDGKPVGTLTIDFGLPEAPA
jgi:hypothetical protein